jgi:hypothetical protein
MLLQLITNYFALKNFKLSFVGDGIGSIISYSLFIFLKKNPKIR